MRRIVFAVIIALHGLVHLMGTVDFWGIADLDEIAPPNASATMVDVLGGLWLVAAIGFVVGAGALGAGVRWWRQLVLATAVLSIVLTGAVWADAWVGLVLSVVIAIAALPGSIIPSSEAPPVDGAARARAHVAGFSQPSR